MTKEEFLKTGLCEQFVLGLTTPEENELVEEMFQAYPELKNDCRGLHNCIEKYTQKCPTTSSAKLKRSQSQVKKSFPLWLIIFVAITLLGLLALTMINRS